VKDVFIQIYGALAACAKHAAYGRDELILMLRLLLATGWTA
jgi:hypothetical protein